MSGLSIVLSAEATRHSPLPSLPSIAVDTTPPSYSLLQRSVLGGYLGGCEQLVWRALGPTVEVLQATTGTRIAAWTFGAVLRNTEAKVLSVCSVGGCSGRISHVVCGVDRGVEASPRGLLAVLSLASSKIVRAFTFTHPVVQVCPITGGDAWVDRSTLHPTLQLCSPLLVLATAQPSLHLIDLALDVTAECAVSDEVSPGSVVSMPLLPPSSSSPSASLQQHRLTAINDNLHLATSILDGSVAGSRFCLLGPSESVLCQLSAAAVQVTALLYIPQLASLAIGYNFGAFQLYNLHTLAIDCASPYEEGVPGVVSFSYQEPENDPRNYVYLWLSRSITPDVYQQHAESLGGGGAAGTGAVCTLYSMTYEKREWIEGHGLWYQGLTAIAPRFEFEADGSPCPLFIGDKSSHGQQQQDEGVTVLFTGHTVTRPSPPTTPPPLTHCQSSLLLGGADDDAGNSSVSDLSLCLFGWYSRELDERGRMSTQHYVALFDINQWYQAQMPSSCQLKAGRLCPYLSFHRLDRVPCGANERVMAAAPLTTASVTRHLSPTPNNDSDWYPTALSYGVSVLSSSGCAWYQCRSAQQSALRWLLAQGPAAVLMCPQEALQRCSFAGLLHGVTDDLPSPRSSLHNTASAAQLANTSERESVLDVCLAQHLLSVLSDCVAEFADGKFAAVGCTLPSLTLWAFQRVTTTKTDNDKLLTAVFSRGEGHLLGCEQLQRLHHNLTLLGTLRTLLTLCAQHTPITTRHAGGGRGEVTAYCTVTSLLQQHLTVSLWFQHCQLLPEVDPSLAMDDSNAVPYPAARLIQTYRNRRQEISELNPSLDGNDLLLIDELMEELKVSSVDLWTVGGSPQRPCYPPPTLQALLNLYLLPDISLHLKHRIVQYLFLDLSSILTDGFSTAVEYLIKFPASAKLSPSMIKLTQAFWLLDQKDYQNAVDLFLDPLVVRTDITAGQHRRILRALLYQNESWLALCYLKGREPPYQRLEDVQLQLSVLLANGRVREAFHYQRLHATVDNDKHLLHHLLEGCEHYGRLREVLQLPLSPAEVAALMAFLRASDHPHAQHILTVCQLRNSRYSYPVADEENKSNSSSNMKQAARTALLRSYAAHIRHDTRPATNKIPSVGHRSVYEAPQPLSSHLRQAALSPHTRTAEYSSRMGRVTADIAVQQPFTPFRSHAQRRRTNDNVDHSKSECSVLFPSRVLQDTSFGQPATTGGRLDATSLVGGSFSTGATAATTLPANLQQSSLRNVSAHITSLLSTPPSAAAGGGAAAARQARASLLNSTNHPYGDLTATPQSILKVRSLMQRPMSQSSSVRDMLVPPSPARPTPRHNNKASGDSSPVSGTCLTPKQLRFDLPTPPLQETSNDTSVAMATAAAPVAASADGVSDSDDVSDLDVQLDPYIHRSKTDAASSAHVLYEEQESWEMLSETQLRELSASQAHLAEARVAEVRVAEEANLGHKSQLAPCTDGQPTASSLSFAGILKQTQEETGASVSHQTRSEEESVAAVLGDDDDDDAGHLESDSFSDLNETYFSFDEQDDIEGDKMLQDRHVEIIETSQTTKESSKSLQVDERLCVEVEVQRQVDVEVQREVYVEVQQQKVDVEVQQRQVDVEVQQRHADVEVQQKVDVEVQQRQVDVEVQQRQADVEVQQRQVEFEVQKQAEVKKQQVVELEEDEETVGNVKQQRRSDGRDSMAMDVEEQSEHDARDAFAGPAAAHERSSAFAEDSTSPKPDARRHRSSPALIEEQSSQDALLYSIEEQSSQDACTSKNDKIELNEISAEEVAACLEDSEVETTVVSKANFSLPNPAAAQVKEEFPTLCFSESDDEHCDKKQDKKISVSSSRNEKTRVVNDPESVKVIHFSSSDDNDGVSSKILKEKRTRVVNDPESVKVIHFSSSDDDDVVSSKILKEKRTRVVNDPESVKVIHFSSSDDDDVLSSKILKEKRGRTAAKADISVPPKPNNTEDREQFRELRFSDSDDEDEKVQIIVKQKRSVVVEQKQVTVSVINEPETFPTLTFSSSEDSVEMAVNATKQQDKATARPTSQAEAAGNSRAQINTSSLNGSSKSTKIVTTDIIPDDSSDALKLIDDSDLSHVKQDTLIKSEFEEDGDAKKVDLEESVTGSSTVVIDKEAVSLLSTPSKAIKLLCESTVEPNTLDDREDKSLKLSPESNSNGSIDQEDIKESGDETLLKSAGRKRRLSGMDALNIIEPPNSFADVSSRPSTPLRRSTRRAGTESPLIGQDIITAGSGRVTPAKVARRLLPESPLTLTDTATRSAPTTPVKTVRKIDAELSNVDNKSDQMMEDKDDEQLDDEVAQLVESNKEEVFSSDVSKVFVPIPSPVVVPTPSPSRRGKRASLSGVSEVASPMTPLRRSGRRSVTPSKFGTPVLEIVKGRSTPQKSKETPMKVSPRVVNDDDDVPEESIVTEVGRGAGRGLRKSVGSVTPVKELTEKPAGTPGRRGRKTALSLSDTLDVIPETNETEKPEEISETPTKLTPGRSVRKARRSSITPELQAISEEVESAQVTTPRRGRLSKQGTPAKSVETKAEKVSPPQATETPAPLTPKPRLRTTPAKLATPTTGSTTSRKRTRRNSETPPEQQSEEEKPSPSVQGSSDVSVPSSPEKERTTRVKRTSTAASRRSSAIPPVAATSVGLRKSLLTMKLHTDDYVSSEDEAAAPRRRSTRPSNTPVQSSILYLSAEGKPDLTLDSSLEEQEDGQTTQQHQMSLGQGNEEEEDDDATSVIRLRPLRSGTPRQQSEEPEDKSRRRSNTNVPLKRIGLKRPRESMRILADSFDEEEEESDEEAPRQSKRRRASQAP